MTPNSTQLGNVEVEIKEGVATICFSHPSHNSLPSKLLNKLVNAIDSAGTNDLVKVIVLKSGGDRTFCAGASFDELMSIEDKVSGNEFFMGFANVINACRKCPKLIIGRVQGKAVGGGVGVASATDYCFATKFASVKLSELAVGIGPFVVGPAVERKLGNAATSQLSYDATNWRTAAWACERGLYAEVFEDVASMDEAIDKLAKTLANSNPESMTAMKKAFWSGTDHWDDLLAERAGISGRLVLSEFTKKAISKFKSKA